MQTTSYGDDRKSPPIWTLGAAAIRGAVRGAVSPWYRLISNHSRQEPRRERLAWRVQVRM